MSKTVNLFQPGILAPVPNHSRYLEFGLIPDSDVAAVLKSLRSWKPGEASVIGFGPALLATSGKSKSRLVFVKLSYCCDLC